MSENSATETIWLTQEAYDKLRKELDHLSGPGRAAISAKIAAAREEGDLSENGGYHAAREEQTPGGPDSSAHRHAESGSGR